MLDTVQWVVTQVRGQTDNQNLNKQRGTPKALFESLITHPALSPSTAWQGLEKAAARHYHH